MSTTSVAPADRALVGELRRVVQIRLTALLVADAAAGAPRMDADRQRSCTVTLVRRVIAERRQSGLDDETLEMDVLRAQFGFHGLRRFLADLAPSEEARPTSARTAAAEVNKICGGTNAVKTTGLRAMPGKIGSGERLVTTGTGGTA